MDHQSKHEMILQTSQVRPRSSLSLGWEESRLDLTTVSSRLARKTGRYSVYLGPGIVWLAKDCNGACVYLSLVKMSMVRGRE